MLDESEARSLAELVVVALLIGLEMKPMEKPETRLGLDLVLRVLDINSEDWL